MRQQRARLLAPSFLVVSTGLACGKEPLWNPDGDPGQVVVSTAGATFKAEPETKCPAELPAVGASCEEPQRCEYPEPDPACFGIIMHYQVAECVNGAWTRSFRSGGSCNPPGPMPPMPPMPPTICPVEMPPLGSACSSGFSPTACLYQLPECSNPITVACTNGSWQTRDVCIGIVGAGGAGQGEGAAGESGQAGEPGAAEGGRGGDGS